MLGISLMKGLCVFYVLLCGVFWWEGDGPRSLYWLGAATITFSVLWMK